MLFVLTGKVQTGKTRWLNRLIEHLEGEGVEVHGVLAPGVWVEVAPHEYDKLGIDNILLPQRERVCFGRRKDFDASEPYSSPEESIAATMAQRAVEKDGEGRVESGGAAHVIVDGSAFVDAGACAKLSGVDDASGLAAVACDKPVKHYRTKGEEIQLAWDFPPEALDRVNEHLTSLKGFDGESSTSSNAISGLVSDADSRSDVSVGLALDVDGSSGAAVSRKRFLVIDEIGRMELQREEGLVSALTLLDEGPTNRYPHALIVVRETLLPLAKERFEPLWGTFVEISPDQSGALTVCEEWGVPLS